MLKKCQVCKEDMEVEFKVDGAIVCCHCADNALWDGWRDDLMELDTEELAKKISEATYRLVNMKVVPDNDWWIVYKEVIDGYLCDKEKLKEVKGAT